MKRLSVFLTTIILLMTINSACKKDIKTGQGGDENFSWFVDQFEDMRVLRYRLPGFESLSLQQKQFIYYLGEAALAGRDIFWDQNFRYNLVIRKTIEAILGSYQGKKDTTEYIAFETYAKRVFFANGIHHHYSNDKFKPAFSEAYFRSLVNSCDNDLLPLREGETAEDLFNVIIPAIFNDSLYARKIELDPSKDIVASSAVNMYDGVTAPEVEAYYSTLTKKDDPRPLSLGLNSKVVKEKGKVVEKVYHSGGLYGEVIDVIIEKLGKAREFAENDTQKKELDLLIDYYTTGSLKTWDDYNCLWAKNTEPIVDYINGFIETYGDPMGMKATWEAIVDYKDIEATRRTEIITSNAQWFEDNSPIMPEYRKEKVTGVAAKVINIAMLGGDCYPVSPLGINLPNADWIRKEVGSKSVTLANITDAIDKASQGSGFLDEFAASAEEIRRSKKYGSIAGALHTDLHECVGHASGKLADGTDPNALKSYSSPLEEARADLFALYYMMDPKIIKLGLLPSKDAAKAEYDNYIRNGLLTQLVRIKPGKQIEQAHMRARALISRWSYEMGIKENVIEFFMKDNKTYVKINDYKKLQALFGELLKEIQRIKSEGDFQAGMKLIENFGVKVESALHTELLERYSKLNLAPYTGFINPMLIPDYDENGTIKDIRVEYLDNYLTQMLYYGKNYSYLPVSLK
ncbi:MAG: dihydrofolate reductase [Bacteroidales bacterium]